MNDKNNKNNKPKDSSPSRPLIPPPLPNKATIYQPTNVDDALPTKDMACGIWDDPYNNNVRKKEPVVVVDIFNGKPKNPNYEGIWGFVPGAIPNDDDDGTYDPKDMWFCPSGELPKNKDWEPKGYWIPEKKQVVVTDDADDDFPDMATIYQPTNVDEASPTKDMACGIWEDDPKFVKNKKKNDATKKPKVVRIYIGKPKQHPNQEEGTWGIIPGSIPDDDGIYDPKDLWFCQPGESPKNNNWKSKGYWIPTNTTTDDDDDGNSNNNNNNNDKDKSMEDVTDQSLTPEPEPVPPKRKSTTRRTSTTIPTSSKKERVRQFPNSAWVYPTKKSTPKQGEVGNLQGVWVNPPIEGDMKEPIEVMIHDRKPRTDERVVSGLYGYKDGAKPDEDGVVDPTKVVFYPPGQEPDPGDNFEKVGYWSSPESTSETTLAWRFDENADMIYFRKHTVTFMGTVISFTSGEVKR